MAARLITRALPWYPWSAFDDYCAARGIETPLNVQLLAIVEGFLLFEEAEKN